MIRSHTLKAESLRGTHSMENGFTLVEILVAMALGLILIGAIIQTYVASKQSYNMTEGVSRMQENHRFVMSHFAKNLDSGGYAGCLELDADNIVNTLSIDTGTYNHLVAVEGTEGGASPDSITITRAIGSSSIPLVDTMEDALDASGNVIPAQLAQITLDSADADYGALEQYQIVTISNCTRASTFMITNDPTASGGIIQHDATTVSPVGKLNAGQSNSTADLEEPYGDGSTNSSSVANVYRATGVLYNIQTGSNGNPSLFASGLELVEGVTDLQVTYGLPAGGGNTKYVNASSITTAQWQTVESVRLTLTMNTVIPVSDGNLISKNFTKTFRVRNRAP
jgi:type IV pilus assembly protein PilW